MANPPQPSLGYSVTITPSNPETPTPHLPEKTPLPPPFPSPVPSRFPPPKLQDQIPSPSIRAPHLLSPANGIKTGSPVPRMSTPPGPPVFSSPVRPAAVPFRTSPASPQPVAFSLGSSLPTSSPAPFTNGSPELQHQVSDGTEDSVPVRDSSYVLFSAHKVLKQKKQANIPSLGFGALISAGREISPGPQLVQRDPHRCQNCGAYANHYCNILLGSGQWQCVICRNLNGSEGEYVASSKEELRNFPELSSPMVDYIQTGNARPGFIPASDSRMSAPIVLVIDECLDESHLQHLQSSLHAFVDTLPEPTRIGTHDPHHPHPGPPHHEPPHPGPGHHGPPHPGPDHHGPPQPGPPHHQPPPPHQGPPHPGQVQSLSFSMAARNALLKYLRVNARPVLQSPNPSPFSLSFNGLLRRCFSEEVRGSFLDKSEVADRVVSVVKNFQKVDPSKVTLSAHFQNDLGLDSLDTVEIVMALEEEFGFEIPDNEADKINTINLAVDFIASHPQAK